MPNNSTCTAFRALQPTRRHVLQAGVLAPFALGLTNLLAAESRGNPKSGAKSVILLFMWGGPAHLDTWDPKPEAPIEVRGEFRSITTSAPGLRISEHFPLLAKRAHKYAVIRSMTHDDPAHLSPVHHLMTGRIAPVPKSDSAPATRNDAPHIGALLAKLQPSTNGVPTCVQLPWQVSHPSAPGGTAPGQHAGWMGSAYDPFVASGDPNAPEYRVSGLSGGESVTVPRQKLLRALDKHGSGVSDFSDVRDKALTMLTSGRVDTAFDLSKEPTKLRDKYGRHTHGQGCLLARRLVEADVRLVCVNWHNDGQSFWDTHGNNFPSLKDRLMPSADQGFAALLDDLDERGLLAETLVVWVGEFGRAPRVGNGGREHWPGCYSAVLAGAGIRGGAIFGSSDRIGARPDTNPVDPADLNATIYHALGIDTSREITDRLGRPLPLTTGKPITALFG